MTELTSAPIPPLRPEDHVRGPQGAPLVIVYSDLSCPRCVLAWERLAGAELRVCLRHFALKSKSERAVPLARAAEAAALQGAFWSFVDAVFADPGRIDDPHLWARCEALAIDVTRFDDERRSDAVAARVSGDVRDGIRAGVTATPTVFAPGDVVHPGPPTPALVREWSGIGFPR